MERQMGLAVRGRAGDSLASAAYAARPPARHLMIMIHSCHIPSWIYRPWEINGI
jgi:hypothetical protein